ncbi:hypothetical protein ACGFNU_01050 [Spirillospora sp. NPDC048911]|uniref:hypothetical protein n=1 Tax=Spirillospora sp. NPDC048911 TaxID=3364527 RepID=UPI00371C1619
MYKLILDPIAEEQINTVPEEALPPSLNCPPCWKPHHGADTRSTPVANMLTHTFGERGLATYVVLEEQREVYLIRVEWP